MERLLVAAVIRSVDTQRQAEKTTDFVWVVGYVL